MDKIEIIKELLGESISKVISSDIKEFRDDFIEDRKLLLTKKPYTRFFSNDDDEELEELDKHIEALEIVYSLYSTKPIEG
jgi:hypothetical protein